MSLFKSIPIYKSHEFEINAPITNEMTILLATMCNNNKKKLETREYK